MVVWNFELYMLPLALLLLLIWNFLFCSGRDTSDMVSNARAIFPSVAAQTFTHVLLLFPQQSMEEMFEWEDEDEDKDEKVEQPFCSHHISILLKMRFKRMFCGLLSGV